MNIKQALISVSDKTGIVEFARELSSLGVAILSTGGTARLLKDAGLTVTEVGDYTGFPEMLDGRVKTLHPKIHAGILARRDSSEHMAAMEKAAIPAIDLVVVNLYPFSQTIARPDCSLEEAIENIDIGGPAMVRAAAKNYKSVAVVTDPADYAPAIAGNESGRRRGYARNCASSSPARPSRTLLPTMAPSAITSPRWMAKRGSAQALSRAPQSQFQSCPAFALWREPPSASGLLPGPCTCSRQPCQLHPIAGQGAVIQQYRRCGCGVGMCEDLRCCPPASSSSMPIPAAWPWPIHRLMPTSWPLPPTRRPPLAASLLLTGSLDGAAAEAVIKQFVEVIIAPQFTAEAQQILARKANVRVLTVPLGGGQQCLRFQARGWRAAGANPR